MNPSSNSPHCPSTIPTRASWRTLSRWGVLVAAVLLLSCGGNPPPNGPDPCRPVPDADARVVWKSPTELELDWVDMPATVGGGNEACVFNRRLVVNLGEQRTVKSAYSFHGFDNGDAIESLTVLYAADGTSLYRRSEHLEAANPDCYDAYDPPVPVNHETHLLTLDTVCRVTGNNGVSGNLSARCHFLVVVNFDDGGPPPPPPPPGCNIAGANDPRWQGLGQPRTTRELLNTAKIIVGDRTGKDPLETLALLAQAIRDKGGCAVGPWDDEIAIKRADGHVDGWHAVAFGTGGYTANPKGDSWKYGASPEVCGPPKPPPAYEITLKKFGGTPNAPKFDSTGLVKGFDYCTSVGFVNRGSCPVRPECSQDCQFTDRKACELVTFGTPRWFSDGEILAFNDNPWMRKVKGGTWVRVCTGSTISPEVCSKVLAY